MDGPRPGNSRQSALLAQTVSGLVVRTVRGQGPDGPGPDTQILNLCPFSDSKIQMGFFAQIWTFCSIQGLACMHIYIIYLDKQHFQLNLLRTCKNQKFTKIGNK